MIESCLNRRALWDIFDDKDDEVDDDDTQPILVEFFPIHRSRVAIVHDIFQLGSIIYNALKYSYKNKALWKT